MPRTAVTARKHPVQPRGGHSGKSVPREIARTPVLFRLPIIQLELGADVEQVATEPLETSVETSQDEPIMAGLVSPIAQLPPVSSASLVPAGEKVEPRVSPAVEPSSPISQPMQPALQEDQARSWWDHWSSGVVLILLIIALITASIMAFNDGSATDPEMLVDQPAELGADDQFSLDSIQVPDVKEEMQAEIVSNAQPASRSAQASGPNVSEKQPQATSVTNPGQTTAPEGLASGLIPDSMLDVSVAASAAQKAAQASTTASLVESEQKREQDALDLSGLAASTSSAAAGEDLASKPMQPMTTPSLTESSTKPQQEIETQLMAPVAEQPQSLFPELPLPALSLESSSADSAMATGASGQASQSGMMTTNMPAYGELLNAQSGAIAPGQLSTVAGTVQQPNISMATMRSESSALETESQSNLGTQAGSPSTPEQSATGRQVQRPIPTATPNQDPDAIIRAYEYYLQMAGAEAGGNRYSSPPSQNP